MMARRLFFAAAMLGALVQTAAADNAVVYRVAGEVNAKNFDALANLAMDSVDSFVGLKVSFPENAEGDIVSENSNGLFLIYRRKGDIQLSFPSGFRSAYGKVHMEGFYKVGYEGLHQGINAISLTPARSMDVEATGLPVKLVEIDKLESELKKK